MLSLILAISMLLVTGSSGFGLSSHVLDTSVGKPAENFQIILSYNDHDSWKQLSLNSFTDSKGRVEFEIPVKDQKPGVYKLFFNTEAYYTEEKTFYPYVEIVFRITDMTTNYHVPITLSPYGYSTYKGSK